MNWIRGLGKSAWIAIGIFFAAMAVAAATRNKAAASKWHDKAVDIETGNVVKGVETAKAALTQAKKHNAKADEFEAKAKAAVDRTGKIDESTAALLDRWRK